MIKNILWDFEGTLADTSPAKTYAMSRTMAELGFSIPLNTIDRLMRQSYDRCIDSLRRRFPFSVQEVHTKFLRYYAAIPLKNQVLYPGVIDVCSWIYERGGGNFIFTDWDPEDCRRFLREHALDHYIDGIYSLHSGQSETSAMALFDILGQYHLDPDVTLMITHEEQLVRPGLQVGIKTCWFGVGDDSYGADWQIDHHDQLLSKLRVCSSVGESSN